MNLLPLLPLVLHRVPAGLRMALAQEGIPMAQHAENPLAGRFILFDSQQTTSPPLAQGQNTIDVHRLREGRSDDSFQQLLDESSSRQGWQIGSVIASEVIATVDKRSVRRRLMAGLRGLLESAGGVWARLAPFPFPYRSAFNFRLDHDEFVAEDFANVMQAIRGYEVAFSHYVCGSTHASQREALAALRGMDVGSHGYWHHTYRDGPANLQNIQRGIDALRQAGIEPSGFVAPHGRFNRGLLSAMQQAGITHSSEFSLAYDDLPFCQLDSNVLQIPVYPVCLGICLEAAAVLDPFTTHHSPLTHSPTHHSLVVEPLIDHFCRAAEARHRAGEPILLYGHPDGRLGRYPQVLTRLLDFIRGLSGVWEVDRTRFAKWWQARAAAQVQVTLTDEGYSIAAHHLPPQHRLAIEFWQSDRVASVPLDRPRLEIPAASLQFQRREALDWPAPIRLPHSGGFRASLRRFLDWEKVTPIEEIDGRSFRGAMKKTLRRVYA